MTQRVLLLLLCALVQLTRADYWADRQAIIDKEERLSLSGGFVLNKIEQAANKVLMKYKEEEWLRGFEQPGTFPPGMHFFDAKPLIQESSVFRVLRALPKGASLHAHDTGMVSFEYLMNITHLPNLYVCTNGTHFDLRFFKQPDPTQCPTETWTLLADERQRNPHIDELIHSAFTLIVPDPRKVYPDINAVWGKFQSIFIAVAPMLTYKPVFEAYYYRVLEELYADKVKYLEVRTTLPDLYDLDGTIYRNRDVVGVYKNITEVFRARHPDFMGAKIIYAPLRQCSTHTFKEYLDVLADIKHNYGDFVLGFDLVGQEDAGQPLKTFLPDLLPLQGKVDFFFHAGETDWYGATTDENLIDAVLLGAKRIGHGYALLKHPELLRLAKARHIAVEVAPISNQVLKLVDDVRNHPASVFAAFGLPIVITNDDPSYWGAEGLSYDWYMAFMGIASRHADLRFLKQLAINSIEYSGLQQVDKQKMFKMWQHDWKLFVHNLANNTF